MHSIPGWKLARRPNYITNNDIKYPYSECPFLGEYYLQKLPDHGELVEHVDYWGEGKIETVVGNSGFANCYNVNHTYQLVSNGPDTGRKIPNRIPVINYTNCDTSGYIKDDSVKTVTIMGAPINTSCAKDIARMIHPDVGRVVGYGFENTSQEIKNLVTELKKKSIFLCPGYILPTELQGLTLFDNINTAFLNLTTIKEQLYNNVTEGAIDIAVDITKNMDSDKGREAITEVVNKLLNANTSNIIAYAYKLWNSGGMDTVCKSFPDPFQLILRGDMVTITNKQYLQALKLDADVDTHNDKAALGDSDDKSSKKVTWKFTPIWDNDNVIFTLQNMACNLYLKLDENTNSLGNRKGWGSTNDNEINHRYYVEPMMKGEALVFRIIDYQYNQALKLSADVDATGNRLLWGHNGNARGDNNALNWIIAANTKLEKQVIAS